jgi:predicted nucleic acid-binding protein
MVIDASAAIRAAFDPPRADRIAPAVKGADLVLAPDLFVAEIVNAVWKYHHIQHIDLPTCDRILEGALALVDSFVPSKELYREAFQLARGTRRPAYDMFYLALARREDAVLLTADAALRKEAERQGVQTG